jgi:membrane fusion protein, multidrug efflux system
VKNLLIILVILVVGACGVYVGYLIGHNAKPGGEEGAKEEAKATASVKVEPAARITMGKTVTGYGAVHASPEAVHVASAAFEVRVRRFLVTPGQAVEKGAVLLEVDPGPTTLLLAQQTKANVEGAKSKVAQARQAADLALKEARSTRDSTAKALQQTQQRLDMKLATAQELLTAKQEAEVAEMRLASIEKTPTTPDLLQAEQDLKLAELQMESLTKLGMNQPQITAEATGIVNNLPVQQGQIVPAGGPLVEVAEARRIEARLDVDPAGAAALAPGQTLRVTAVSRGARFVDGTVRLVAGRVNPATRLVDVFVTLPPDSGFLLETYVRGQATVEAKEVLAVPRAAVLTKDDKDVVYTIKDDKAVEHEVKKGLEDEENVELAESDLKVGQQVVVEGNYELENGMAVKIAEEADDEDEKDAAANEKAPPPAKKGEAAPEKPALKTGAEKAK